MVNINSIWCVMKSSSLLKIASFCLLSCSVFSDTFSIQEIGPLPDPLAKSCAYKINNSNVVSGKFVLPNNKAYDFTWSEKNGFSKLPTETSFEQRPLINDQGQLAGLFWKWTGGWFFKKTASKHIYFSEDGISFQDLGFPPDWNIQVITTNTRRDQQELCLHTLNNRGEILFTNAPFSENATRFCLWANGNFQLMDELPLLKVYALNNQGVLLGIQAVQESGQESRSLVLYNLEKQTSQLVMKTTLVGIPPLLNDQGEVAFVKAQNENGNISLSGLLWHSEGVTTDLADFLPIVMNNRTQIVGVKISTVLEEKQGYPVFFLWEKGNLINLNEALGVGTPHCPWTDIMILGLNDNGYLIGQGVLEGKTRAFIISPSPETVPHQDSQL